MRSRSLTALLALTATASFLSGCGGIGALQTAQITYLNSSNNQPDVDIYVFPNTTGSVQSISGKNPTLSLAQSDGFSGVYSYAGGTYQFTVTAYGSTTPLVNVLYGIDPTSAGTITVVDNGSSVGLAFP